MKGSAVSNSPLTNPYNSAPDSNEAHSSFAPADSDLPASSDNTSLAPPSVSAPTGAHPPVAPTGYPQPMSPHGYPPYPPQGAAGGSQTLPPSASRPQVPVGYPQAGYPPMNPGAGYPPYGSFPGIPQPKKSAGDFVQALKAIWSTFVGIHKSEGQLRVKANSQLKHWWWVMMLIFSLLAGLSSSVLLARSADIFSGGLLRELGIETVSYTHLTLPTNREV